MSKLTLKQALKLVEGYASDYADAYWELDQGYGPTVQESVKAADKAKKKVEKYLDDVFKELEKCKL